MFVDLTKRLIDADKFPVDKGISGVIMFDMKYVNTLTRQVGWERNRRERSRGLQASYSGTF